MSEEQPKLKVRQQGQVQVVEFEDRKILEELVISQINEKLSELVEADPQPRLLLDFKNVEHMSSAALSVLIDISNKIKQRKGKLVLTNIQPQIFEVFKITRLNKLLNIQSTTQAALEALA